MKSSKLLAALAGTAMLAACSNEELFKVDNAPQEMQEVVGYKLLGTDLSLNATTGGVETRMDNYGKWQENDVIGLGWIVEGDASSQQKAAAEILGDGLWANHMFDWDGKKFSSKGNIYEGWYFGYFKWGYEAKPGVQKKFQVNPAPTKGNDWNSRLNQNLHLSALQFLGGDAINKDGSGINKSFELYNAVNNIIVTTTAEAGSSFDAEGSLKDLAIKTITITADEPVFVEEYTLYPSLLHRYTTTLPENSTLTEAEYNKEELEASFATALVGDKKTSVTTSVEGLGYVAGGTNNYVTIVAPYYDGVALDVEKISIELAASSGKFVIKYVKDAKEGTSAFANNKALMDLVAAYAPEIKVDGVVKQTAGALTKPYDGINTMLNVQLYNDIFEANWGGIINYEDWNERVLLAEHLGIETPTFTLAKGADVDFSETTFPEGGVNVCTENQTVNTSTITIPAGANFDWVNNVNVNTVAGVNNGLEIVVEAGATLNIKSEGDEEVVFDPCRIINNGLITVDGLTTIGSQNSNRLTNNNEIRVLYGAYVYPAPGSEPGIISYVVQDIDNEDLMIKQLVNGGTNSNRANVNTLILDGKTLDITGTFGSNGTIPGNRYDDSEDTSTEDEAYAADLTEVDFVIYNGGILKIDEKKEASVMNVTIGDENENGGGSVENVNISGNLNVIADATVTNDFIGGYVDAQVDKANEANVITTGSIGGYVVAKNFVVEATTGDINGYVEATNATVNAEGNINGYVKATEATVDVEGNISGAVEATDSEIEAASIGDDVTLNGTSSVSGAECAKDVTVESGVTTFNNVTINGTLTVKSGAEVVISGKDALVRDLANYGTLTTNVNVYTETVAVYKGSTANIADEKTIWFTKPNSGEYGYIQNGSTHGNISYLGNDVLVSTIEQLQAALDNAGEGTTTIAITGDLEGNAIVTQKEGVNIVIDGRNKEFDGIIYIYGQSRYNGEETLDIRNLNFNSADVKDFIDSNSKDSDKRYAHNVTITNCTFSGNAGSVGMRLRQAYDIIVKDCKANGIHSFVQNTSCSYQKYENCTVNAGGGINILTSGNVDVINCNITATEEDGYGVRVDATNENTLNITGSTINAYEPIVLRSAKTVYKMNIETTALNATSEYQIVVKGQTPILSGVDNFKIKF